MKWSEDLRNRVSVIIRRYTDNMKFYCFVHTLLVLFCIYGCMLCMFIFNFVYYIFLLLFMFHSRYCVSLCCSVYCLFVNVYCTTATGCQPKCSYQIYHIVYHTIILCGLDIPTMGRPRLDLDCRITAKYNNSNNNSNTKSNNNNNNNVL